METKKRRILWLLNHSTLREAEVPLLVSLGFEVFIPKQFPQDESNRSASVTYRYDETLSIPPDLLKKMNDFDFYASRWPAALKKQINAHFEIIICGFFPTMLNAAAEAFQGDIYLRVFGLAGEATYANLIGDYCSPKTIQRIRKKEHICLAPSYANIADNEPAWLRHNAVFLPLGLPQDFFRHEDQWKPEENQIFFVCPRIKSSPLYNTIYREFKSAFGEMPHIILGAQPEEVSDDPHVAGFMPEDDYYQLMKTCRVMFYHSREVRHLHYHPLEAVVCGLPLIFMSGGMLDHLTGEKLPGCCDTLEEARSKVKRILAGDEAFTQSVLQTQKVLLKEFDSVYVREIWEKNFPPVAKAVIPAPADVKPADGQRPFTVGIWIHTTNPEHFAGEGIYRLLGMILKTAQERTDIVIRMACVSWVKDAIRDYLEELGIDRKSLQFITVDSTPPILFRIYRWWTARRERMRKKRPSILHEFLDYCVRQVKAIYDLVLTEFAITRSPLIFFLWGLVFLLFSPLILLYAFYLVIRLALNTLNALPNSIRLAAAQRINSLTARMQAPRINALLKEMMPQPAFIQNQKRQIYDRMVKAEFDDLAETAAQEKDVNTWFFLYPKPSVDKFKAPVVVAVPDVVYLDFPTPFSREVNELLLAHSEFSQTISKADLVITYSDYVKEKHVVRPGFQPAENVRVIRHAPVDTRELILSQTGSSNSSIRHRSSLIIRSYIQMMSARNQLPNSGYLQSLPFGEFDYLFVSSQTRPHKNHLNLLKAYRVLLRERYLNTKLVFTGQFSHEMQVFIHQNRLHLDVLSFNNLPARVHAAFYGCARLAVAPTLFEGGFPFVFSEALSMGTPVVMSDIPVVREVLTDEQLKMICFDPYDVDDMVARIAEAYENHEALLTAETAIYREMKQRTWDEVADEYLAAFQSAKKKAGEKPARE